MKHYKARWGLPLIVVSSLLTVLCVGVAYESCMGTHILAGLLVLALPLSCALFTIRGYTVTPDAILIHRLFWVTRLPLVGLQSARFEPRVMRWSIRCGNGGFYSITGFYWSKILGLYRAFVTDMRQTVVLRYTRRTVVVSPTPPEELVHELAASDGR